MQEQLLVRELGLELQLVQARLLVLVQELQQVQVLEQVLEQLLVLASELVRVLVLAQEQVPKLVPELALTLLVAQPIHCDRGSRAHLHE